MPILSTWKNERQECDKGEPPKSKDLKKGPLESRQNLLGAISLKKWIYQIHLF